MKPIIVIKNLSKKYKYGESKPYYTLRDTLVDIAQIPSKIVKKRGRIKLDKGQFWALKDINLEVKKGEVLGVIGPNGAGKTTLLKILSRITPPTRGEVGLRGRVASLLEVGTGFHQELTGRENIFLNGAILGMSRKEIKSKYDEIVDFAGVERFLSTPIKHYSSGMRMRLAFSVAAHLEPEILLVDEVLSVGDIEFQKKSLGKMQEISQAGRTVLFVSHNLSAVRKLCSRAVLLKDGVVSSTGPVDKIISKYNENVFLVKKLITYKDKDKPAQIKSVRLDKCKDGKSYDVGENIKIYIKLESRKKMKFYLGTSVISESSNIMISWRDYELDSALEKQREVGTYNYEFVILGNTLPPGRYRFELALVDLGSISQIDYPKKHIVFDVVDSFGVKKSAGDWKAMTSVKLGIRWKHKGK